MDMNKRFSTPVKATAQCLVETPLGAIRLARSEAGLCGAWFDDQRHQPVDLPTQEQPNDDLLACAGLQLQEYFANQRKRFDLPLAPQGTDFQCEVWQALLDIDCGQTSSYGALAKHIGRDKAVRAIGGAVGRNPISIIVPCHRVLGSDMSLTGYDGGLHRKRALLTLERALWREV